MTQELQSKKYDAICNIATVNIALFGLQERVKNGWVISEYEIDGLSRLLIDSIELIKAVDS